MMEAMQDNNTYSLVALPIAHGVPVNTRTALLAVEDRLSRHQFSSTDNPGALRTAFWNAMAEWCQLNLRALENQGEGERAAAG